MAIIREDELNGCIVEVSKDSFDLLLKNGICFSGYDNAPLFEWVNNHKYYWISNNTAHGADTNHKEAFRPIYISEGGLFIDVNPKEKKEIAITKEQLLAEKVIESKKRELNRAIKARDERLKNFGYESSLQEHQKVEALRDNLNGMNDLFKQIFS